MASWLYDNLAEVLIIIMVGCIVLGLAVGAFIIQRARFDACVAAVHDAHYCTLAYPLGAHKDLVQ